MALIDKLTAIADAIRGKTGKTDEMTLDQMATEISNITTGGGDDASALDALIARSITEISSNATSIGDYAFYSYWGLTSIDFPMATSVGLDAFCKCSYLTSIDFPMATSIGNNAFRECPELTTVNLPVATSIGTYAFYQCSNLTSIDLPRATSVTHNVFRDCPALTTVNLPVATSIGTYAFGFCSRLTTLIIRSETVCTLGNTNAFSYCYHFHGTVHSIHNPDGLKDAYIYVPSALVAEYQAATNWSTFATQFRALEDYTVDGTITGELDPDKI